ncbi:MAG: regulator of protease activity HflC (stomatin/prohibitin superfamily) [Saprospiraceae bacterium]|jgi:regulator of protease activity HflC (stomatin/prohibitin superfamily)
MKEKIIKGKNGFVFLFIALTFIIGGPILGFSIGPINGFLGVLTMILTILTGLFTLFGLVIVNPNQSRVLTLFGKYVGSIRENGFQWVNPFKRKRKISLRARNFDSERVKVNDKRGNPILISVILVWRVRETYKAAFEVDDYESFIRVQTDAAVRKLAGMYSYDNFDDDLEEVTLRSDVGDVNDALESEVSERLEIAGLEVIEARIGYLAYAPEIASAMLKRQQAEAIVAARFKIVEGAVGMVDSALELLSEKNIIELDDEKKAAMVSNLMVVLCSDKEATPILNTGTLNT